MLHKIAHARSFGLNLARPYHRFGIGAHSNVLVRSQVRRSPVAGLSTHTDAIRRLSWGHARRQRLVAPRTIARRSFSKAAITLTRFSSRLLRYARHSAGSEGETAPYRPFYGFRAAAAAKQAAHNP